MVNDTEENQKKCICSGCPSFPPDCKGEVLYCAAGKSSCDVPVRGCICSVCPVYVENRLSGLYFCDKAEQGASGTLMRKKRSGESDFLYQTTFVIKDIEK